MFEKLTFMMFDEHIEGDFFNRVFSSNKDKKVGSLPKLKGNNNTISAEEYLKQLLEKYSELEKLAYNDEYSISLIEETDM